MKPSGVWMALSGLMGSAPEGWNAADGIDFHFMDKATDAKKPIFELESPESSLWATELTPARQETGKSKCADTRLSGCIATVRHPGDSAERDG